MVRFGEVGVLVLLSFFWGVLCSTVPQVHVENPLRRQELASEQDARFSTSL